MLNYRKLISDFESSKKATNRALADLLDIPEATFRTRRDRKNFTPDDIEKLADYFGRTIAYYFDREERQTKPYAEPEAKLDFTGEPCPCCEKLKDDLERLSDKLKDKQEIIDALKDANTALKGENESLKGENKKNVANRAS